MFPPPNGFKELEKVYGSLKYTEMSGGNVTPDVLWAHDNLVSLRNVAGTKLNIQLHRLVAPHFEQCLIEAVRRCPSYKVRMLGGYCARHMRHDPKMPLSIHSWGAAFDVNWDKNPMVPKGSKVGFDLPAPFIAAFTEQGWEWGGSWKSISDFMHFQYARGV